VVGDIFQVIHTVALGEVNASASIFYIESVAPTPGRWPCRLLAESWNNSLGDSRRNLLSHAVRRGIIGVRKRSGDPEPPFELWNRDFPGTRTGSLIAPQSCVIVRLKSFQTTKTFRSTLYLAGPSQNDQHAGQWLRDFSETQITNFCNSVASPVTELGGGPGIWSPVVVSQQILRSGNYSDIAWSTASYPVHASEYSGRVGLLRKRKLRIPRHGLNDTEVGPVP